MNAVGIVETRLKKWYRDVSNEGVGAVFNRESSIESTPTLSRYTT